MKKIASNELKEFLQDWLNWAEGRESIHNYRYGIGEGLCLCSEYFDEDCDLQDELSDLFDEEEYPFGKDVYISRKYCDTQHQDPNRLAWVRAALNDTLDTWELME